MRRVAWGFFGVVAVLVTLWIVATYYYKARAAALYAALSVPKAPPVVRSQQEQLKADFQQLLKLQPGLGQVEYKYLSQPLEETQSYLFSFAMLALKNNQTDRWELAVRLLNGMWLSERLAGDMGLQRAARLNLFQQRINGLYAQARLSRRQASLPKIPADAWGGRYVFADNFSRNYCKERWQDWALWGGFNNWYIACSDMEQLLRWNEELRAGRPLKPATVHLNPAYEVLLGLQKEL